MTHTFYDALGRVQATMSNWNPATLSSPNNCVLSPTNESVENVCTLYGYDAFGNQITTTNALNQTSLSVYDEINRPVISVANWDRTSITGEADCSFPPAQADSNLCTVTYYDERGRRSAAKDPLGNLTEFGYDGQGRLITTTRYLSGTPVVTLNHYDVLGNRVGQSDALGHTSTYVYDDLNRLAATVSAEGVATVRGYDELGRVVTTTNGLGQQTVTDYDTLGRRSAVTDAVGNVTRYEYDSLGQQVAVTNANGIVTRYEYDALNRQVAVVENWHTCPGGQCQGIGKLANEQINVRTEYVYDVSGKRVVITNALGFSSTQTTYDALGRPVVVQDALGNQTYTRYNALGNRTVFTDADGAVTRYSYDGLNRLIGVQYPDSSVQYSYDALGRRMAMTDTLGVTTCVYDDLGRLASVSDPLTGTVGYGYDLSGNRTQLVYPGGKVVTYTYDADNRLIQLEDWDGGLTSYEYDAAGRLVGETLPNGVDTARQYDAAGRLIRLTHTAPDDSVLSDYVYTLDGVGNRTRVTETLTQTTRIITNVYDALNRLTGSEYSSSESFAYVHDALGNRTLVTSTTPLSGTVVTTYTYDAANRLSDHVRSDGRSYTYTWSKRGQLLAEWVPEIPIAVREFSYDGAGRMTQARVLTLTTRFVYNGDGARRTVEVMGYGATTYTLDYARGNRVLAEETLTGTLLYLYGYDCLGQYDDAEDEWLYYLNDGAGYVRQGADEQGQVVSSWLFDPDGMVLEGPNGLVSHLICGGVYDWSTGLIHRDGRYFDPMLGIWLALAPLVVVQSWKGRKRKRRGMPWYVLVLVIMGVGGMMTGCEDPPPTNTCTPMPPPTSPPGPGADPSYEPYTPVPSDTPEPTPSPTPSPTPEPQTIEWFDEEWLITHYIYVLENDPMFANDDKVVVPGLDPNKTYRRNFIYGMPDENGIGPRGVAFQGTGKSEAEEYITIDHLKTKVETDPVSTFHFIYGEGGAYAGSIPWKTVGTRDPRLKADDKIVIEMYPDMVFTVTDTGTMVDYTNHLDVFVGEMTLAEADRLGDRPTSRVGKVVEH